MKALVRLAALTLLALAAACSTPDLPWPSLEAKYANASSRFADLPGGLRVHYRDQGRPDGRAIVLVHGFSASLHAWEPWVERLGRDYRIVTLDLPGHGLTRATADYRADAEAGLAVIDQIADRLALGRFVIGGNSMGGGLAWNYALTRTDRIEALVLVDAVGPRQGPPPAARLLSGGLGRAIASRVDPEPLARRGLPGAYVDPAVLTPQVLDRYVELARAPGHRALLVSRKPSPPRDPAAIRAPTLVMTGELDTLVEPQVARALATAIPGAQLVTYPGVGHVPMEQIPDQSAADVRRFLEDLPEPKPGSGSTAR